MRWLLRSLPTNPTTITGRMLGIATATSLLAVVDSSLIPLLSQLIWVVIVAFVCGLLFRPRLEFYVKETSLLVNGQASAIEMIVENAGNYPVYDVQLSFPYSDYGLEIEKHPKLIEELAVRGQVVVSFQVQATARGEHQLPTILIASLFPFGMFRFSSKRRIETRVIVAPSYTFDVYEDSMSQSGDSNSAELSSRPQRALEYIGSREYREGLPVRRWDFAAWARLGIPTIREFNEAHESTALIVVDLLLKSRDRIDGNLEALLSKTATAAVALSSNGFRLVLVMVGTSIAIVDGYGNRDQADAILRCLARVSGALSQPKWTTVWDNVEETMERDWALVFFLRSDHQGNAPSPPDEFQMSDVAIDWTPGSSAGLAPADGRMGALLNR